MNVPDETRRISQLKSFLIQLLADEATARSTYDSAPVVEKVSGEANGRIARPLDERADERTKGRSTKSIGKLVSQDLSCLFKTGSWGLTIGPLGRSAAWLTWFGISPTNGDERH